MEKILQTQCFFLCEWAWIVYTVRFRNSRFSWGLHMSSPLNNQPPPLSSSLYWVCLAFLYWMIFIHFCRNGIELTKVPRAGKTNWGFLFKEKINSFQTEAGAIYQRCKCEKNVLKEKVKIHKGRSQIAISTGPILWSISPFLHYKSSIFGNVHLK